MVINLSPPFSLSYKKGYLSTNPEGRKIVSLYNSASDRRTISYARYLKSVELGYEVPADFEVDHKDDNKKNDGFSNFQLLTKEENILKASSKKDSKYKGCVLKCEYCGHIYSLTPQQERSKTINKTVLNFCSMACSGKYYHRLGNIPTKKIDTSVFNKEVTELRNQGLSDRKIAIKLNISRWGVRMVK